MDDSIPTGKKGRVLKKPYWSKENFVLIIKHAL